MNHRLENEKVSSLLFSLALPSILAQLATLIYNMVDRIYIGRLPDGGLSIAGIGLCTSIITIITAFSNLFGRGGAPLASIKLGEKNPKEAERYRAGETKLLGLFVGKVMKESKGKANPKTANELVTKLLGS